ncbi:hypothetical protein QUA21_09415 [Microcoleus sp. Pol1B3]|uniref:hypothetical protein n=1 Tax=unclassified Microcoleus TaxID=2642155 RepID=UPI002FD348D4
MRTEPVKYSADPSVESCEPFRVISTVCGRSPDETCVRPACANPKANKENAITGIVSRFISVPPCLYLVMQSFPTATDACRVLEDASGAIVRKLDQTNLSFLLKRNPDAYNSPESFFIALASF